MEQAYTNFNAGKYKEALNLLNSSNQNFDSYQPNVAACEYLSNRNNQTALNYLKKLNEIINKRVRLQEDRTALNSEQIIKYNMAIVLTILGKKENALIILKELYNKRQCFIQYIQYRILFHLMQLEITLKNYTSPLILYYDFPIKPKQTKSQITNWASIILYEHNKSSSIVTQELYFISQVLITQSLIGLGLPQTSLPPLNDLQVKKNYLMQSFRKRRSNINKYYQINIIMMDRFLVAQRNLHNSNITQCLSLLNLNNNQQLENVPISKISLNIFNSLALSNVGLVHYHLKKNNLALHFFRKGRQNLLKCLNCDDRELQLLVINYINLSEKITQNIGLVLLKSDPEQAYNVFETIKKSNRCSTNYKWWYRVGQAALSYYHHLQTIKNNKKNTQLLQSAYEAFSNAQLCIKKIKINFDGLSRLCKGIKQEDLEQVRIKMKGQIFSFYQNIKVMIAYTSLGLGLYHRTIQISKQLILQAKLDIESQFCIKNYLLEAYVMLGRLQDAKNIIERQATLEKSVPHNFLTIIIEGEDKAYIEHYDHQIIIAYELCLLYIKQDRIFQASNMTERLRQSLLMKPSKAIELLINYLNLRINGKKNINKYGIN